MSDTWDNIGSGVGAGSSLLGMFSNNTNQKRQYGQSKNLMGLQNQYQRGLNQQGHDLQMDMWNKTNYGAQIEHMKNAGLNPALMYGMSGGGGSTTGSQGGGSQSMGGVEQQKNMGIEGAMAMAQMELMKAQAYKATKEGDNLGDKPGAKVGQEISESISRQEGIDANKAKTIQETLNLKTIDQWNRVKKGLDELKESKKVTGSQITDLLSNLGLDPVNNSDDREKFQMAVGLLFGASVAQKLVSALGVKGIMKK
tara:strand:+ start:168 stop:929 length:762 start_codon:yes stop_codon:yes gene_type:complete